ncbi:uncharacterized protein [Apostichopus japonicus]|uniref:uncharacterized protein isoform X2 n=1 Tax=Stichopus japonicus TaxID=307972 RepID=UPI003AB8BC1E
MKTLLLLFGIFFLSVLLGSAEGKMVAFVNFVVRHSFVTQSNDITDMTVAAAFKPHEISETISGTNLWRLGFFGARNMEGTGPRANEIHQLLPPAQRSQTAFPGQNLTFDASSRVNLNNIGPDQSFPFYCVEFAKNPLADPDFTFQVANDEVPAILCQNSQSLPRSAPEQETRPSALFTSVITRFQITRSPDDTIPSRATITVTLEPHPRTDVITGTNLWQLGFFGSRNSDGSGERKNESPQLLLPVQASQPLHPNEPFVLSVERLVNMAGIGPDESFPYLCVEFGKQPTASPEFLFLGSDEDQTIVLCENARDTKQVPDAFPDLVAEPDLTEDPILIEFTTNDLIVQEDNDDVTINLNLNQINDREDLTINFRIRETNPVSATSGEDFREETVSTTVPIGSQVASVTVRVLDDDQRERTETFVVEVDETTLPENVQVDGQNFITIHIEDSDGCSNEYFEMEEVCYRKVVELLNFDEAREVCQQDGAELASVSTPNKNSIVSDIANGQRCWVGAVVHGDEYTWLNGDPWSFSNWRKGEPNWHRRPLRACIETNFVRPTLWNDHFCHAKRLSVCEKPLLPEPET